MHGLVLIIGNTEKLKVGYRRSVKNFNGYIYLGVKRIIQFRKYF